MAHTKEKMHIVKEIWIQSQEIRSMQSYTLSVGGPSSQSASNSFSDGL